MNKTAPIAGESDIVGFTVENTGTTPRPAHVQTFGQVFIAGDVPADTQLMARIGDRLYPVQMDVKATHDDGSVRHAILSVEVPDIGPGEQLDVMLTPAVAPQDTTTPTPGDAASALLDSGYDFKAELSFPDGTAASVGAADLLREAVASGDLQSWINGPLSNEFTVSARIGDQLELRFDIRANADGSVRTDVSVHNDYAYNGTPKTITYDIAFSEGGQTVFSQTGLDHYARANWHKQFYSGGEKPLHIVRDVDYMEESGAIPGLDTSIEVGQGRLDFDAQRLADADTGPLEPALNHTYMPGVGQLAGDNVGLISAFQARYLLSQDERAEEIMLANADASGGIPWHLRDADTGMTTTIADHPGMRLFPGQDGKGEDAFGERYNPRPDSGWTPDTAHQPALNYLPYLLTGDQYYLNELQAQAVFNVASLNVNSRGYDQGIVLENDQVRGQAWTMRTLSDTAFITPDDNPLKNYFSDLFDRNMKAYVQHYVTEGAMDSAGDVEGYIFNVANRHPGAISPWQDDYFTMAIAQAALRGNEDAGTLLDWKTGFTAGRFLAGDEGFDPLAGTGNGPGGSRFFVFNGETGEVYTTWEQVYKASFAPGEEPQDLAYVGSAGGYTAVARGALAQLISATGSPEAIEAYGFVVSRTENTNMVRGFKGNPKWAFAARLEDGSRLTDDAIAVGRSGNDVMSGTDRAELLHGAEGNDTIAGDGGIDLLFGGAGNDSLQGDSGNDYLFGGSGTDILAGGAGKDFLKGGNGADLFVLGEGSDRIADFRPGEDHIDLSALDDLAGGFVLTQTGDGLQIRIDGSGDIIATLDGVTAADFDWQRDVSSSHDTPNVISAPADPPADSPPADPAPDNGAAPPPAGSDGNDGGTNGSDDLPMPSPGVSDIDLTHWVSGTLNPVTGDRGSDILQGGGGNDLLDGGRGHDVMIGGRGDDLYVFDHFRDQAVEDQGGGTDTVIAYQDQQLGDNLENLLLERGRIAKGNALDNTLVGNDHNNILQGLGGDDTLYGGSGMDELFGGAGNDTFIYDSIGEKDIVRDFQKGADVLDLRGLSNALGQDGATLVDNGYLSLVHGRAATHVLYDADGSAGAGEARIIVTAYVEGEDKALDFGTDIWL